MDTLQEHVHYTKDCHVIMTVIYDEYEEQNYYYTDNDSVANDLCYITDNHPNATIIISEIRLRTI